jgi:hypothetical protein
MAYLFGGGQSKQIHDVSGVDEPADFGYIG